MAINFKKRTPETETANVTQIQNEFVQEQTEKKRITTLIRKKLRRRMTVIAGMGALVLVPLGSTIMKNVNEIQLMDKKIADAEAAEKAVQAKNEELKVEVGLLQDKEYVAKLARSRYYLSKDGEIIFSLPEDNQSKAAH